LPAIGRLESKIENVSRGQDASLRGLGGGGGRECKEVVEVLNDALLVVASKSCRLIIPWEMGLDPVVQTPLLGWLESVLELGLQRRNSDLLLGDLLTMPLEMSRKQGTHVCTSPSLQVSHVLRLWMKGCAGGLP
jgi:hypothetical protein